MKATSGKKYTVRELAERFGCDVKTIRNHANKLWKDKIHEGKTTYFDELEITVLLESIKNSGTAGRQATTRETVSLVETELSLDMQIAIAERKAKELWKRKAEQAEARVAELTAENKRLEIESAEAWEETEHADRHANYVIGIHQWHGEQAMRRRAWLPYRED